MKLNLTLGCLVLITYILVIGTSWNIRLEICFEKVENLDEGRLRREGGGRLRRVATDSAQPQRYRPAKTGMTIAGVD